ncbi:1-phosphatidylinositol-4,5-bisphosphate phosphodiesterase 1 [Collybia nuda]|uniref:Phosphoinositide phospholipase C n=1 Tax=Collybia nuda TaxID=64659 RepID=A0A9P5XY38_9AGAR|nr:1-phosphatidylinositol-4,5-bisphosphate phosphodiesterase 1 [Collybia nuda]
MSADLGEIVLGKSNDELPRSGASTPLYPHNTDFSVPDALLSGTIMTKVSEKKQKQVIFHLDPDEGRILYKSRKTGMIPIETIKEIRAGTNAHYYREQFKFPEEAEARWITVIYILEGAYKTLHMLAPTRDVFLMWDQALHKLFAIRQGLMTGLGNLDMRQAVWERQYWKGADKEGDQRLVFDEVETMCKRLNVNLSRDELRRIFTLADPNKQGYLDFPAFQHFVKVLKRRPEIERLYDNLRASNTGQFDFTIFEKFMYETQKSKLSQTDLQAIFDKYSSRYSPLPPASVVSAQTPLQASSPSTTLSTTAAAVSGTAAIASSTQTLSVEGFISFLLSPDNAPFSEKQDVIWQDMSLPISEYYISSSHNTYLVGHQLVGVSTIEGYIRALLHSCRSVELDIYDGDSEPVIFHGKTLTSKVPLRDICQAIAKYAFMTSPYALLISAEVHCGIEQQDKMVEIMTSIFGEALISAPVEGRPKIEVLPSPEDLKGKFLLKAKNLYVVAQLEALRLQKAVANKPTLEADPSSSSSSSDSEKDADGKRGGVRGGMDQLKEKWRKARGKDPARPSKPKVRMSFKLASLLVYTVGVKCHGIDSSIEYAPEHIFSLSENTANKLVKASMTDLVKHNQNHMVRIYPKGTRVNSTNYAPHRYWAAGAQVVAINWQTFDLGYMINQAMFQRNGRSGYILKPPALREGAKDLLSKHTKHFLDVSIISAQQLPRLKDSSGQEIVEKSVVDPFVQVSLHIPDWTHSPFLPESATTAGAKYSAPTDATLTAATSARTVSFNTCVVKNNGFNPVWQEELCLPFDCIGDMKELIFVEFAIRQEGKDDNDDAPIAIYCTPLSCLESGFRHLPLHDSQLTQHLFSTLFVKVSIRDVD